MSSNYPPGVTDRDIARAAGELPTCRECGKEFVQLDTIADDTDICRRCRFIHTSEECEREDV